MAVVQWGFGTSLMVLKSLVGTRQIRTGSTQQVRLGRMSGVIEPVGRYECRVPDSNGVEQVAAINIQLRKCYCWCM